MALANWNIKNGQNHPMSPAKRFPVCKSRRRQVKVRREAYIERITFNNRRRFRV